MLTLRPYQRDANERVYASWEAGNRGVILCLPTGGGKTVTVADVVHRELNEEHRVLIVAHRRELISQPFATLIRSGIAPDQVGIVMAGVPLPTAPLFPAALEELTPNELWGQYAKRRPGALVQIASVDSLRTRQIPPHDVLVVDEAHRSLAKSYLRIREAHPSARLLGLTATPQRSDKRGLSELYDDLIVGATYAELVQLGYLAEPTIWSVPKGSLPDLSGVKTTGGDYNARQLAERCDRAELVGDIVSHYQRRGNNAPALAFATGVEHSQRIAQQFNGAGIPAAHVDGATDPTVRDQIFRDLQSGAIKVVANCDVATEGTDLPAVKTVILARPTKSLRVYLQQVGRGSRPHENGLPFVVLDHAGCARDHGLPQADREWSLEARPKRQSKGAAPVRECEECFAVLPSSVRVCPECGFEFSAPARKAPKEADGELVLVQAPEAPEEIAAAWAEIVDSWHAQNAARELPLKPGWCFYEYQKRHGAKPSAHCSPPTLTREQVQARERYAKLQRTAKARGLSDSWVWREFRKPPQERPDGLPEGVDADRWASLQRMAKAWGQDDAWLRQRLAGSSRQELILRSRGFDVASPTVEIEQWAV